MLNIVLLKRREFLNIIILLKSQNFDAIKPHKYTVSCGDPVFFSAGIKIPTSLKRREFLNIIILLKSQNFDEILTFLGKFLRGRVRVANLVFEITLSQAITLTLLLVCSFSPRVHSIPRGPLTLKSQNFDEIVFFSAGSEKSSVLWRTRFFGFRRKSKISQNYDFLIKEFGVFG